MKMGDVGLKYFSNGAVAAKLSATFCASATDATGSVYFTIQLKSQTICGFSIF